MISRDFPKEKMLGFPTSFLDIYGYILLDVINREGEIPVFFLNKREK